MRTASTIPPLLMTGPKACPTGRSPIASMKKGRSGVARLIVNHRTFPPSQAHQKQRPFPPPALPGLIGLMALSDSQPGRRPFRRRSQPRPPPDPSLPHSLQIAFPACRAHYPGGPVQVPVGCGHSALPRRVSSASPVRQTGWRPRFHFRGLLKIHTHYGLQGCSAPFVGFIARLRPNRSLVSGARKLSSPTNKLLEWVRPPLVIGPVGAH